MLSSEILELKTPWPLVNVEEENGDIVVRFHAEGFLWPCVEEVGRALSSLLDETEGPFVLDFAHVTHMTGAGLEKLVRLNMRLDDKAGKLVIKNVAPNLMNIFSVTGLTEDFDVIPAGDASLLISKPT